MQVSKSLSLLSALCVGAIACAQTPMTILNTKEMKWGPAPNFLPKGAQLSVLSGDPMAAGLFVIRLKMPANYVVPAHFHSGDELLTIISGDFYGGMGDVVDKSKSVLVKAGGYITMPAKMHHYAFTKGPAIVQITGQGPFDITYLDPATDPTKQP